MLQIVRPHHVCCVSYIPAHPVWGMRAAGWEALLQGTGKFLGARFIEIWDARRVKRGDKRRDRLSGWGRSWGCSHTGRYH